MRDSTEARPAGINYHAIERKSASACVSKICTTTDCPRDFVPGGSHAIHDAVEYAARIVAHLDARVSRHRDLHMLRMKFPRDGDTYIYIYIRQNF